jgi:hypothetical protein
MLWFFKDFRRKIQRKKWRFWLKTKLCKLCKILIITLVFEKNANFFAENWGKSPKIVLIFSYSAMGYFWPISSKKYSISQSFGLPFSVVRGMYVNIFTQKLGCATFWGNFNKPIWDRCYDFKNIFAENFGENIGVFCSNYCNFAGKKWS